MSFFFFFFRETPSSFNNKIRQIWQADHKLRHNIWDSNLSTSYSYQESFSAERAAIKCARAGEKESCTTHATTHAYAWREGQYVCKYDRSLADSREELQSIDKRK